MSVDSGGHAMDSLQRRGAVCNKPSHTFLFLLCLRDLLGSDTRPRQPWKRAGSSGCHRAFRGPLARVLLQASEECAQRSRARRSLARRARGARGQFKARVDLGEARVRPDVLAPADDTIGECDVRLAAGKAKVRRASRCASYVALEKAGKGVWVGGFRCT